jgi:Uma2 family endonuclease
MATTTRRVTADDLAEMGENASYELIRGVLREVTPSGGGHGRISVRFGGRLDAFVDQHDLGGVYGAETGFVVEVDPDTVLVPDVTYVRAERLPPAEMDERFVPVPPDLVVEVISPSNRTNEIDEQVRLYLDAGVPMVVLVFPRRRTLDVYRSAHDMQTLTEGDSFDGQDVVPGFRLPVAEIFRSPRPANTD